MSNEAFDKMMRQFEEDLGGGKVVDVMVVWATADKPGMNTAFFGDIFTIMGWMGHIQFDLNHQLVVARMKRERPTIITPGGGRVQ